MAELGLAIPSILSSLCCFLLVVLFTKRLISKYAKRHLNMPPLPPGLPLLGNSLQLNPTAPYKTFTELAKRHGDIYTLGVWGNEVVVINSYELLRDAMVKQCQEFAGRPYTFRLSAMNGFGHEIVFADLSRAWIKKKHIVQKCFRQVGNTSPEWEEASHEATRLMLEDLDKKVQEKCGKIMRNGTNGTSDVIMNGNLSGGNGFLNNNNNNNSMLDINEKASAVVALEEYLQTCSVQSISLVLFGRTLYEDEYKPLFPIMNEGTALMNTAGPGAELDLVPGLWYLYYLIPRSSYWKINSIWEGQRKLMEKTVKRTKELKERGEIPTRECLYDMLIEESKKHVGNNHVYKRNDIIATVSSILIGGVHPVTSVVLCIAGLMANHPDVQQKVHNELKEILGSRKAQLSDRDALPYLNAVIQETMRYTSTAPLIIRKATADIKIAGYDIPKETLVLGNLYLIHHDERYWEDPWTFKPERFLNDDGQLITSNDIIRGFMPFGAGRRLCTGQAMARNNIYLMASALLQRYTFKEDPASAAPVLDPRTFNPGLVPQPQPFKIKLEINAWS